jgi:murein DD-endopeptidase MepM/ murein hydrolase activator NlpD
MAKDFLDPGMFSDAKSAIDLHHNFVRQRLRGFDAFGGRTIFEAIVLSKPIFLADAQLSSADSPFSQVSVEEGRMQKFSFKGRIVDSPSPHDFLPDPCNMNDASDDKTKRKVIRVTNLHTTFISSDDYTRTNATLPNIGDKVRVELTKNVHSYNLQYGKFLGIASNLVGPDIPKTEQCLSSRIAFGVGTGTGGPTAIGGNMPDTNWKITGDAPCTGEKVVSPLPPGIRNNGSFASGRGSSIHGGCDFAGKIGTPIFAIADGKITKRYVQSDGTPCPDGGKPTCGPGKCGEGKWPCSCGGCMGNYIMITHSGTDEGRKIVSYYAHLSTYTVEDGAEVTAGQQIGTMGTTGNSSGPHLHLEIRIKGSPIGVGSQGKVDPIAYMSKNAGGKCSA